MTEQLTRSEIDAIIQRLYLERRDAEYVRNGFRIPPRSAHSVRELAYWWSRWESADE
jgi:hypothetical protein